MPLVRVDMYSTHASRREAFSAAIHRGLVSSLGMPADDLFQVFRLHEPGDLFYSPSFPDADRDDIVFVQILLARLYDGEQKQAMGRAVVSELAAEGVKPDNVLIACTENDGPDWYAPGRDFAASATAR
ncbi:tautomerase-like protein [Motilibacter peucedani]|uniref:Tautomerase-like protein n=1 Tax=Motilibacter peucedani TaxID=598650 RepID=A0A420XKW8_9ACTN|nr:tautomerase family protein [Motilibacter peucedani]RKS69186.1 tautomerase-like protein [Motilibacter peucedani]